MTDKESSPAKLADTGPAVDFRLKFQFCAIGCVALLGWNFVLGELGSLIGAFGDAYGTWVSMCYSLAINLGQLLLVYLGNRFRFAPRFDIGCVGMGVSQMLIAVSAVTFAQQNQTAGFVVGCILIAIFGFANALMESSMFGLAAMCPASTIQWIMIGEGIAGLIAWPLNILIQKILEAMNFGDVSSSKLVVFFAFALLGNLLVVPMFKCGTMKHPYMQHVFTVEANRSQFHLQKSMARPINLVIKDTLPQACNVWACFVITFTVFPWLIFQVTPSNLSTVDFGALMVYCYQVFDTVGRFSLHLGIKLGKTAVRYATLARALCIPFFFLCVHLTVSPFDQDWFRFVLMAVFAWSNGLCATWIMIHGPTQVKQEDKEELEVAGYTMAFALINGIFIGSLIALIIQDIWYL